MATMYPNKFPQSLITQLRGEAKVYEALNSQLDSDWIVYSNVIWSDLQSDTNRKDGETDFIISHPKFGVITLEVKGGMQIAFNSNDGQWRSIDQSMSGHIIKNPYEQARSNMHSLIRQISRNQKIRDYQSKSIDRSDLANIHYAVVFPDVTRISSGSLPQYVDLDITFFEHDVKSNLNKRLVKILNETHINEEYNQLTHDVLKQMLAPSFTLDRSLKHWIDDESHQMYELTDEQYDLLNILQFINRASIYGCAGSGKTLLAKKKAELMSNSNQKTLLVCFNNILGRYLTSYTQNDLLTSGNFHLIINDLLQKYCKDSFDLYNDKQLLQLVELSNIPKYDCILIDEAQDFSKEQMDILHTLLKENGIIYYFWDSNQKIIRHDSNIPKDIPIFPLTKNLRNTRIIFEQVKQHYKQNLILSHKGPEGREVQTLEPYNRKNAQQLFIRLREILDELLFKEDLDPSDITILTFKAKNKTFLRDFTYQKAPVSAFQDNNVLNSIRIDTVRRFKGMESNVVIVCELDDSQCLNDFELFNEMCYVSFSRAKHHLVVIPYL